MGLKVLLADESTSIKKAFQLALADYGVEVKSVPSGLDVLSVSLDFVPDIIFADVLLTKKSGYEVCKEIKSNSKLAAIPFILMWSHFMEFDTAVATAAGFTDKLEKPFDTEMLRQKINTYVSKTKKHPLHEMIEFPNMPNFVETETMIRQKNNYLNHQNKTATTEVPTTEIDDDFEPVQLKQNTNITQNRPQDIPQNVAQNSDAFEIQIETENFGDFEEVVLVKSDQTGNLQNRIHEQIQNYLEHSPVALSKSAQQPTNQNTYSSKATNFDEQMMREEVRLMAEKICWQIIPDITEKIVREEITKLLTNLDKSI
jgi:two-component system, cell cycle response regulator